MDSIFNLEESQRSNLLQQIIHSFGFTYVCLLSHFPHHSNCLIFVDGVYKEENNQVSSSSGSLAMMSFLEYQKSMFLIDNYHRRVPGFAFMHNLPYMEHTGLELLELASSSSQLQFYQVELELQTAIFMGCKNGEIELGMSNGSSQVNIEFKLKKLFTGDFPQEVLPHPLDQSRASSSSSSLRSLSMEKGVGYPPFLFNMLQTSSSYFQEPFSNPQAQNQTPSSSTMRSEDPLQQALSEIRATQLIPSREDEEAAMTRAILAAISPPPPSSHLLQASKDASAFKRYQTYLGPTKRAQNRQNLNIRSLSFFRKLREDRAQQEDRIVHTTRPTSNQLHHMISERKRRGKLNESFQALRSLLPPGSKKDKASVLSRIQEFIASLKSQVDELNARNKILEAEHSRKQLDQDSGGFSGERLNIQIKDADESTSDTRGVELEVNVRGNSILSDLVVRVMEFVNQVDNVTITSIDARTLMLETEAIANRVVLRLSIKGSEWNRSSFQEALTRALDDLA
ncbi:hypothetical protein L1987_64573 [Smallanthus sonchifolius]|uniref:Uncharacterized protein n=1 Tax=Smallanthus sonchifolius TaxID=185202 RepID=A0ACB9BRZ8_9ASTR|nr:hypothetical protein L1987_64573 [Smallanthus sonchifolius]